MDTHNAALTLAEVDRAARRTRSSLHSIWFPLVVFGALTLAAGALAAFARSGVVAVFSLVGFFACAYAVSRYYAERSWRIGVATDGRIYRRIWIAYLVGGSVVISVAQNVSGDGAALLVQGAVFALFYLALARLSHSRLLGGIGLFVAVVCSAIAAVGPSSEDEIVRLGVGAILVASGLYARTRETGP